MTRTWTVGLAALLAVAVAAWTPAAGLCAQGAPEENQEPPAPKEAPPSPGAEPPAEDDEDQLTPEEAMELLRETEALMKKAEELLNDSSRGKALETEEEAIRKLKEEFKDDPALLEKQILEKIRKLTERATQKQKSAMDKLAELIRKAKS